MDQRQREEGRVNFGFFDQFLEEDDDEDVSIEDLEIGNPFEMQITNFANGGGIGIINPMEYPENHLLGSIFKPISSNVAMKNTRGSSNHVFTDYMTAEAEENHNLMFGQK